MTLICSLKLISKLINFILINLCIRLIKIQSKMKTAQRKIFFQLFKDIHPEYEMRSVKSLQHLPQHLNQNFHHNNQSYFSFHHQNSNQDNYKKTSNPILEPQQPQNYLSQVFDRTKQVSVISSKSQPLKVTRRKKSSQNLLPCCTKNRTIQQKFPQSNGVMIANDNQRTRKHLIQPLIDFPDHQENGPYKQYCQQHFFYRNNSKTRENFHNHTEDSNNEQTLRRNHKKCPHKTKSKLKLKSALSLQNLNSRLTMCEAYIDIGQRKTNALAQEVDFLLRNQQQRQERKMKSRQLKHQKHLKEHRHHDYGYGFYVNCKNYSDRAEDKKEVSLVKKTKRTNKNMRQSSGKFHYRSCDNRDSSSRMRELIYFNENGKSYNKKNQVKPQRKTQNDQEQINKASFKMPQANVETSIYQHVERLNIRKPSQPMLNTERLFCNSQQRPLAYSNFRVQKAQSCIDNVVESMRKSDKKPYEEESEYLLEEYENDTLRQTKQYNISQNTLQKSRLNEVNFPFVHSERLPTKNSCSEFDSYGQEQYHEGIHNEYLTKQFQASEEDGQFGLSPKRLTFWRSPNHQSYISNYTSIKLSRSRKVGHFTQGSIMQGPEAIDSQINQGTSPKMVDTKKVHKTEHKPLNSVHASQMSGKGTSQKQYTFINHDSNRKNSFSGNFQVIESNLNSPQQFGLIISSNDNTQTQLIRQFDDLVIAAAQKATPMKKKLIREQIYRTAQQIRQLNLNKHEKNPNISRSIQHK